MMMRVETFHCWGCRIRLTLTYVMGEDQLGRDVAFPCPRCRWVNRTKIVVASATQPTVAVSAE